MCILWLLFYKCIVNLQFMSTTACTGDLGRVVGSLFFCAFCSVYCISSFGTYHYLHGDSSFGIFMNECLARWRGQFGSKGHPHRFALKRTGFVNLWLRGGGKQDWLLGHRRRRTWSLFYSVKLIKIKIPIKGIRGGAVKTRYLRIWKLTQRLAITRRCYKRPSPPTIRSHDLCQNHEL